MAARRPPANTATVTVRLTAPGDGQVATVTDPFGGYKQSGTGREMGVADFEEYLEIKSVAEAA